MKWLCGGTFKVHNVDEKWVYIITPDSTDELNPMLMMIPKAIIVGPIRSNEEDKEGMKKIKPTLGMTRLKDWEKNKTKERINDITAAMYRYSDVDKSIPNQWIDELIGRIDELERYCE
jgi:hypothetical protein